MDPVGRPHGVRLVCATGQICVQDEWLGAGHWSLDAINLSSCWVLGCSGAEWWQAPAVIYTGQWQAQCHPCSTLCGCTAERPGHRPWVGHASRVPSFVPIVQWLQPTAVEAPAPPAYMPCAAGALVKDIWLYGTLVGRQRKQGHHYRRDRSLHTS